MTLQSHAEQCGNLKTNAVTIWAVTTMAQWLGFWRRPSQLIKESFVNKSYYAIIIIIIIVSLYLSTRKPRNGAFLRGMGATN